MGSSPVFKSVRVSEVCEHKNYNSGAVCREKSCKNFAFVFSYQPVSGATGWACSQTLLRASVVWFLICRQCVGADQQGGGLPIRGEIGRV